MTDDEKKQEASMPPTEPPAAEPKPLTDQKKNALLRYMAILFGVAFLLVALSFLIQMRDSNQEITQLSQSNASALQNAEKLQSENRALTEAGKTLTAENQALHDELLATREARDEAEAALKTAKEALETAKADDEAAKYLAAAAQAFLNKDPIKCREALAKIGKDAELTPQAQGLFDQLTALLTEKIPVQE